MFTKTATKNIIYSNIRAAMIMLKCQINHSIRTVASKVGAKHFEEDLKARAEKMLFNIK